MEKQTQTHIDLTGECTSVSSNGSIDDVPPANPVVSSVEKFAIKAEVEQQWIPFYNSFIIMNGPIKRNKYQEAGCCKVDSEP